MFDISAQSIRYQRCASNPPSGRLPKIGASAIRHAWDFYCKYAKLPEYFSVYKPSEERRLVHRGAPPPDTMREWLEELVGWMPLKKIARRAKRSHRQLKYILHNFGLWEQVYQHSCKRLSKAIREQGGYHLPHGAIIEMCKRGVLRSYREGLATIVKPVDAEWLLDYWRPGMTVTAEPGGECDLP